MGERRSSSQLMPPPPNRRSQNACSFYNDAEPLLDVTPIHPNASVLRRRQSQPEMMMNRQVQQAKRHCNSKRHSIAAIPFSNNNNGYHSRGMPMTPRNSMIEATANTTPSSYLETRRESLQTCLERSSRSRKVLMGRLLASNPRKRKEMMSRQEIYDTGLSLCVDRLAQSMLVASSSSDQRRRSSTIY